MSTSTTTTSDRIEKRIQLKAPRSRVWKALTDPKEFGAWFKVALDGPFKVGESTFGNITYPGYEHLKVEMRIERMDAESVFAYRWHPNAIEVNFDYSREPMTLCEFRLEEKDGGTLLTLTESGFDKLPAERRAQAFRSNDGGWTQQMANIEAHVTR